MSITLLNIVSCIGWLCFSFRNMNCKKKKACLPEMHPRPPPPSLLHTSRSLLSRLKCDAGGCVGEREKSAAAILGGLGKSWLPGVWEKCSWQVLNPGIPLCWPLEKHYTYTKTCLFVNSGPSVLSTGFTPRGRVTQKTIQLLLNTTLRIAWLYHS